MKYYPAIFNLVVGRLEKYNMYAPYLIIFNTISIMGEEVEVVVSYKYLRVHLDKRLDWNCNSEAVYREGQGTLYFLRKLRSFNVCSKMLQIFYQSAVASASH